MTVRELIDRLEEVEDDAREVRFVYQQVYPLQDEVRGVWEAPDAADPEEEDDDDDVHEKDAGVVFIVSGGQFRDMPYGPRRAFEGATR